MRRSDREITDREELLRVMGQCDVCRLALNDEGWPYIIPVNFGMEEKDGKLTLYFHGATEGKKYDLMARDSRASFEMDRGHRLVGDREKGYCTMEYESVMGRGRLEVVSEEEKLHGLELLMAHYYKDGFPFSHDAVPRTTVFKLTVETMTGKRRKKSLPQSEETGAKTT